MSRDRRSLALTGTLDTIGPQFAKISRYLFDRATDMLALFRYLSQ